MTVTLRCTAAFTDDPMIPDSNEFLPRGGRTRQAIAPLRACKSNYAGRDVQQSEYYSVPYRPSNVTRPCRASPPFNVRVDGSRKTRGMYLYTKRRASDFISAGAASRARDTQRGALARARTQSRTCTQHTHGGRRGGVAKYRYAHGDETVPAQWTEGAGSESS